MTTIQCPVCGKPGALQFKETITIAKGKRYSYKKLYVYHHKPKPKWCYLKKEHLEALDPEIVITQKEPQNYTKFTQSSNNPEIDFNNQSNPENNALAFHNCCASNLFTLKSLVAKGLIKALTLKGVTEITANQYVNGDLKYLFQHLGRKTIKATTKDLQNYLFHLKTKHGYQNSSLVRRIGFLRRFYDYTVNEGFRNDNPAKALKYPRIREKPIPFLTEDIVKRILSLVDNERDELIIELLFYEGLRKGELLKLKKNDIDLENNKILVNGKGNKIRILPLHNNLKEKLAQYIEPMDNEALLFPLEYRYVTQLLEIIGNRISIHLYPHLLRHSFAANLYKRTKNIMLVKKMLGHSKIETTVKYLRSLNVLDDFSNEYQEAFSNILS